MALESSHLMNPIDFFLKYKPIEPTDLRTDPPFLTTTFRTPFLLQPFSPIELNFYLEKSLNFTKTDYSSELKNKDNFSQRKKPIKKRNYFDHFNSNKSDSSGPSTVSNLNSENKSEVFLSSESANKNDYSDKFTKSNFKFKKSQDSHLKSLDNAGINLSHAIESEFAKDLQTHNIYFNSAAQKDEKTTTPSRKALANKQHSEVPNFQPKIVKKPSSKKPMFDIKKLKSRAVNQNNQFDPALLEEMKVSLIRNSAEKKLQKQSSKTTEDTDTCDSSKNNGLKNGLDSGTESLYSESKQKKKNNNTTFSDTDSITSNNGRKKALDSESEQKKKNNNATFSDTDSITSNYGLKNALYSGTEPLDSESKQKEKPTNATFSDTDCLHSHGINKVKNFLLDSTQNTVNSIGSTNTELNKNSSSKTRNENLDISDQTVMNSQSLFGASKNYDPNFFNKNTQTKIQNKNFGRNLSLKEIKTEKHSLKTQNQGSDSPKIQSDSSYVHEIQNNQINSLNDGFSPDLVATKNDRELEARKNIKKETNCTVRENDRGLETLKNDSKKHSKEADCTFYGDSNVSERLSDTKYSLTNDHVKSDGPEVISNRSVTYAKNNQSDSRTHKISNYIKPDGPEVISNHSVPYAKNNQSDSRTHKILNTQKTNYIKPDSPELISNHSVSYAKNNQSDSRSHKISNHQKTNYRKSQGDYLEEEIFNFQDSQKARVNSSKNEITEDLQKNTVQNTSVTKSQNEERLHRNTETLIKDSKPQKISTKEKQNTQSTITKTPVSKNHRQKQNQYPFAENQVKLATNNIFAKNPTKNTTPSTQIKKEPIKTLSQKTGLKHLTIPNKKQQPTLNNKSTQKIIFKNSQDLEDILERKYKGN